MPWRTLGNDSYSAANELFVGGRWRSVISRAYYAAYSAVTRELLLAGVPMPTNRDGPYHSSKGKHDGVAILALTQLPGLTQVARNDVSSKLMQLYTLRLIADYRPRIVVNSTDARQALRLMVGIFQLI